MIFFTIVCVLIGTSVAEHCQSDINISPISNVTCHPLPDCTGINCTVKTNTPTTVYYTVTVENCEDPVLANFSYYINSSRFFSMVYNDSTVIPYYGGYHLDWTMYRNASHLFFHSEYYNGTDLIVAVVPHTVISLNASYCMCQSIQSLAQLGESPVETNCTSNPNCTGLECTFNLYNSDYKVETEVNPCTHPPGIDFYIKPVHTNQILFHRFFNTSSNATILGLFPLHVTVEHRNYSMIISIDTVAGGSVYHLVPRSQIILDKSNCSIKPSSSSSTSSSSTTVSSFSHPTPTSVPVNPTCASLQKLNGQFQFLQCTVNGACDTIDCGGGNIPIVGNVLGDRHISFQVVPCNNPPAINVQLHNSTGVIYQRKLTNTTDIPLAGPSHLTVVVRHDQKNAIGFQVQLHAFTQVYNITPYNEIPIDRCYCSNVVCSSTHQALPTSNVPATHTFNVPATHTSNAPATHTSTTVSSFSHPTPTSVPVNPTCASLQKLNGQFQFLQCTVNGACDTIDCGGGNIPIVGNVLGDRHISFQVVPCNNPPAINVQLHNSTGVIYQRKLTNTTDIPLAGPSHLTVVVRHDQKNAIGFQVQIHFLTQVYNITPYNEIPIDRCYCSNVVCSSTHQALPTSNVPATHTFNVPATASNTVSSPTVHTGSQVNAGILVAEILVPLLIVGGIIVLSTLVIVFVVLRIKRKRSGTLGFQRLSFGNTIDDYDDEKNDL